MATQQPTAGKTLQAQMEELRTALTPVLGYLDFLVESDAEHPSADQLHWVDPLERQLRRLHDVSGELLELCETWQRGDPDDSPG